MPLHPQINDFLERYYAVADTMSLEQISLEQLRHYFNLTWLTEHVEPVKQVQNRMIPGQEHDVPIRVYTPEGDLRNEEDAMNPYSSPLLYKNVTSLPPAMVITAEFDPLRDEGKAYAERLQQAGVPVHYTCYKGMIHQFFNLGHEVDAAKAAIMEAALALKDAFTK